MANVETQEDRRERVRRGSDIISLDELVRKEELLACVKKDELSKLVKDAVKEALESYRHECIMDLKDEDVPYIRDFIGSLKEVGDGSLSKAVVIVRENHKFVSSLHKAAAKIGWGVIILVTSAIGSLGLIAAGVWKQSGGNL